MFYEWVTKGAAFGIEAFFALFVFLAFCAALVGFAVLLGSVFRAGGEDEDKKPRAY